MAKAKDSLWRVDLYQVNEIKTGDWIPILQTALSLAGGIDSIRLIKRIPTITTFNVSGYVYWIPLNQAKYSDFKDKPLVRHNCFLIVDVLPPFSLGDGGPKKLTEWYNGSWSMTETERQENFNLNARGLYSWVSAWKICKNNTASLLRFTSEEELENLVYFGVVGGYFEAIFVDQNIVSVLAWKFWSETKTHTHTHIHTHTHTRTELWKRREGVSA